MFGRANVREGSAAVRPPRAGSGRSTARPMLAPSEPSSQVDDHLAGQSVWVNKIQIRAPAHAKTSHDCLRPEIGDACIGEDLFDPQPLRCVVQSSSCGLGGEALPPCRAAKTPANLEPLGQGQSRIDRQQADIAQERAFALDCPAAYPEFVIRALIGSKFLEAFIGTERSRSIPHYVAIQVKGRKRIQVSIFELPEKQPVRDEHQTSPTEKARVADTVHVATFPAGRREWVVMHEHWSAVDSYFSDRLARSDAVLDAALFANRDANLPPHDVSPLQGRFLQLLVRMSRASRVLEIGTLGGYSTIWMARALSAEGRIVTLEANSRHVEIARANLDRAGLAERVDLRIGPALETLPGIYAEQLGPFDLVFIDADKASYPEYLAWALRLTRPGSIIIGDNVVRAGAVILDDSADPRVRGVRSLIDHIADEPRLMATAIQTVGSKGWDGFVMALVIASSR